MIDQTQVLARNLYSRITNGLAMDEKIRLERSWIAAGLQQVDDLTAPQQPQQDHHDAEEAGFGHAVENRVRSHSGPQAGGCSSAAPAATDRDQSSTCDPVSYTH